MRIFGRDLRLVIGLDLLMAAALGGLLLMGTLGGCAARPDTITPTSVGTVGAATPVPPSTGRCLQIAVPATDYEQYQAILAPDDLLWIRAPRGPKPGVEGLFFSEERYGEVKDRLMELRNVPVRKGIIFSSYEDLEDKIDDIKPCVDIVAYNTEPSMTPENELSQVEEFVKRFAQLARSRGLAVAWGPTSADLSRQPELLELASHVDQIGLQHQNVLEREGVEETVSLTRQRSLEIRGFNPEIEINLQLKGDLKTIEDVLRQTVDYVDMLFVLTPEGVPFDFQRLFSNVDLRSGCAGQPVPTTPTAASPTVFSPAAGPSGGLSIPFFDGIGLLLLMAFWGRAVDGGDSR